MNCSQSSRSWQASSLRLSLRSAASLQCEIILPAILIHDKSCCRTVLSDDSRWLTLRFSSSFSSWRVRFCLLLWVSGIETWIYPPINSLEQLLYSSFSSTYPQFTICNCGNICPVWKVAVERSLYNIIQEVIVCHCRNCLVEQLHCTSRYKYMQSYDKDCLNEMSKRLKMGLAISREK